MSKSPRNRALLTVVVAVAIGAISIAGVAAFGGGHGNSSPPRSYPLASNGYTGLGGDVAASIGRLSVRMTAHGACAWINERGLAYLWPKGYRVTLDPVRLLDPTGKVVAKGGEVIHAGGGVEMNVANRCARPGQETFSISNGIGKGK